MGMHLPFEDEQPTMSEFSGVRYLHLGTEWIQGAMRLRKPTELVLGYTQQMMGWLLFCRPEPTDFVGIMGLGAGSLLRFTLKHTPCQVETVEWNPAVTAMCQSYFRLPASDRSSIDHVDAALWVKKPHNIGRYSALMIDLYDAYAQGPVRDSVEFYRDCYHALCDTGAITVNLFGNHASYDHNVEHIMTAFEGNVLEFPPTEAGNRVILAYKGPLLSLTTQQLLERARELDASLRLPATRWARYLLDQIHPLEQN